MFSKVSIAALLVSVSSVAGVAYDGTCTQYLKAAGGLPQQGDCDDGLVCEKVPNEFYGICMPDPVAYNSCGYQYFQEGCSPGECMIGTYCDTSNGTPGTCMPGSEPSNLNYGLCDCNDRENPDEWETLCHAEDNPCEVAGVVSNCCEGYTCTLSDKIYPTCSVDPKFDQTSGCCMSVGTKKCMPGDCCEGSFCKATGPWGVCTAGEEKSGMHNGLCRTDEALLHCVGSVAGIHGDPHVTTFDQIKYNCMGKGEFVVFKSEGKYFEIQGRFMSVNTPNPRLAHKINKYTNVQGIVVNGEEGVTKLQLNIREQQHVKSHMINGCPVDIMFDGELQNGLDFRDAIGQVWEGDGFKLSFTEHTIDVEYDSGIAVQFSVTGYPEHNYGCELNTFLCLPSDVPEYYEGVTGMLGTPNGISKDDWIMPNGVKWYRDTNKNSGHGLEFCTKNYCMDDPEVSLFDYEDWESFEMYKNCDPTPPPEVDISDAPTEVVEFCDGNEWCLVDGIVGGIAAAEDTRNTEDFLDCVKTGVIGFAPPPPAVPNCPTVELIAATGDDYENIPIEVIGENTDNVMLKLVNPFNRGIASLMVEYSPEAHASDKCYKHEIIFADFEETITAYCMDHVAETVMHVYVSDDSLTSTERAPECCHGPDLPTSKYSFKIKCSPECPEAVVARNLQAKRELREEWVKHFGEYKGGRKY